MQTLMKMNKGFGKENSKAKSKDDVTSTHLPKILITFSKNGQNGGPYVSHLRISNSELKEKFNFVPLYVPRIRKLLNPVGMYQFVKRIRSQDPDIVHCAGLQFSGFLCTLACKLAGVKNIVLAIRGSSTEALGLNVIWKKIIKFIEMKTLQFSSVYYGVSKYVLSLGHIEKYRSKCHSKCYGVVYNLPHDGSVKHYNEHSVRKEYNFGDTDVVIISTGRITYEKGYSILSDALLKLDPMLNIKTLIVGEGDYLPKMKVKLNKMVKEKKVYFLGYRRDVSAILSESDIFVLCTLHETLSNSTIEAGMEGLPAIVSNVGGVPEIIEDGYNGILVPLNDSVAVAKAMNLLIENEILRREMGQNAKMFVNDKFSRKKILKKIDNLYMDLLTSSSYKKYLKTTCKIETDMKDQYAEEN